MTQTTHCGAAASSPLASFDMDAFLAREAERKRRADELRPANKTELFDALAAGGVRLVLVNFDGCGDSGQIETVDACDGVGAIDLPTGEIAIASAPYGDGDIQRRSMPLAEAIEHLCYELLELEHAGWENNDGAYGEFIFDVPARTITLDHNDRYTAVESYSHEW